MLKAMLRGLLAHKLRLVLSALAVVLGTMFMSGALIGGDSINKGISELFSSIGENIDVQVTAAKPPGQQTGGGDDLVTKTVPQDVVDKLSKVDGAAAVVPNVFSDGARVIDKFGKVVPTTGAPRFGVGWDPAAAAIANIEVRQGNPPSAPDQIMISANLAEKTGYGIGDKAEVITLQPRKTFTITGITGLTEGRDSLGGETYVFFTEPVAQELMLGAGPGNYSGVDVTAASGVQPAQLKQNVQAAVGDQYTVQTGKEAADAQAGPIQAILGFLTTGLAVFGGLALFTGLFLIFNTFSMLIAQRTRELALYRSFGANRGQVLRSVLLESTLLGLAASIAGLLVGILIGWGLKSLISSFGGFKLPGGVVVKPYVIILTLLLGTIITVLAALIPAMRASRVAPIEAMRDAAKPDKPLTVMTTAGAIAMLLGVAMFIARATKAINNNWLLAGGAVLAFLGAVLLAPMLAKPVTAGLGKLMSWGVPGKLGVRNTGRNPRRTALTAAALMIGVTLATGAGVFASSAKAGLARIFAQDLNANLTLQVDQTAGPTAGFDPAIIDKVKAIPGVTHAAAYQSDSAQFGNWEGFVTATNMPENAAMLGLKADSGELRALQPGEAILPEQLAKDQNLPVGSTATLKTARGEDKQMKVIGTFADSRVLPFPQIFINPADATGFRSPLAQAAYIKVDDESQVASVRSQIASLVADNPEVTVGDPTENLRQANAFFDIMLTVLNVLLGLTILVAILGVINTLLLSVFERTKELGLLRAVGLGRGNVGWMVTVESVLISLFGALLGLVLGTLLGIALVKILGGDFLKLTIPWGYLVAALIGAVIAGLLAALIPAYRASRLNVLQAISYE
jgi:putative ABC transport system permease protein